MAKKKAVKKKIPKLPPRKIITDKDDMIAEMSKSVLDQIDHSKSLETCPHCGLCPDCCKKLRDEEKQDEFSTSAWYANGATFRARLLGHTTTSNTK